MAGFCPGASVMQMTGPKISVSKAVMPGAQPTRHPRLHAACLGAACCFEGAGAAQCWLVQAGWEAIAGGHRLRAKSLPGFTSVNTVGG